MVRYYEDTQCNRRTQTSVSFEVIRRRLHCQATRLLTKRGRENETSTPPNDRNERSKEISIDLADLFESALLKEMQRRLTVMRLKELCGNRGIACDDLRYKRDFVHVLQHYDASNVKCQMSILLNSSVQMLS